MLRPVKVIVEDVNAWLGGVGRTPGAQVCWSRGHRASRARALRHVRQGDGQPDQGAGLIGLRVPGEHLGSSAGLSPATVTRLAQTWGARCPPSLGR